MTARADAERTADEGEGVAEYAAMLRMYLGVLPGTPDLAERIIEAALVRDALRQLAGGPRPVIH